MSGRYWVIADTHLGHESIVTLAGRPLDYGEQILRACRAKLCDKHVLIHLGDVALGNAESERAHHKELLAACNGAWSWLVLGNHDKRSPTWYLDCGWDAVTTSMSITAHGRNILFTHAPFPVIALAETDWVNIHGHLHGGQHHGPPVPGETHVLVSLEARGYKPFPLEDLLPPPAPVVARLGSVVALP